MNTIHEEIEACINDLQSNEMVQAFKKLRERRGEVAILFVLEMLAEDTRKRILDRDLDVKPEELEALRQSAHISLEINTNGAAVKGGQA